MAQRIAGHNIEAPSAENLRRMFDSAVCELHHADLAVKKKVQYGAPIFQRRNIPGISEAGAEKRAVSDAARALAQLWKISGHPAR
jgi:hypothetical protein